MTEGILHARDADEEQKLLSTTQQAINVFLASKQDDGLIGGIGYWQVANGYTAMALHGLWSGNKANVNTLAQLLATVKSNQPGFINEFNDDSMWWAMCNLEMYRLTNDQQYFTVAAVVLSMVSNSVIMPDHSITVGGKDMEGAVKWTSRANETKVNAITTGLFSELAARVASQSEGTSRQKLLDSAQRSLFWILRCRYIESSHLVLDTIDLETGECNDWSFTYNTGQAMAAAVAIFQAINDGDSPPTSALPFLKLACDMARDAMKRVPLWIDNDGTLTERNAYPGLDKKPAWQNDDAVGFKAVLVRSLAKLYLTLAREDLGGELRESIRAFIRQQFHSLRTRNSNDAGQYGPWWAGPWDLPTSHSQLPVLDVMAAMHAVLEHAE